MVLISEFALETDSDYVAPPGLELTEIHPPLLQFSSCTSIPSSSQGSDNSAFDTFQFLKRKKLL